MQAQQRGIRLCRLYNRWFRCCGYLYLKSPADMGCWASQVHPRKSTVERKREEFPVFKDGDGLNGGELWMHPFFCCFLLLSFLHRLFYAFILFCFFKTCTLNYVKSTKITFPASLIWAQDSLPVSETEPSLEPGPLQTHLSLNHLLSLDHTANYIEPDQRTR